MKRLKCSGSGLAIALAVFVSCTALAAEDYKGAEALLTQISAKNKPGSLSPGAQWVADVEDFHKNADTLPPDEAARQWLDLASRYATAFSQGDLDGSTQPAARRLQTELNAQDVGECVLLALPGPAAWPALAKIVDARPPQSDPRKAAFEDALRLLAHTLVADSAGQGKAVRALLDIKGLSGFHDMNFNDITALEDALADESDDPASVAAAFRAKIEREKKLLKQGSPSGRNTGDVDVTVTPSTPPIPGLSQSEGGYNGGNFNVPDLVTILGEKEAASLLKEAILLPEELTVTGAETKKLALKVALEEVATMKTPHWELAGSLDGAPLFEALEKRFPVKPEGGYSGSYTTALQYYFLHLIVDRQTARAVKMAESPIGQNDSGWIPVDELEAAGYTAAVDDFLHDLLAKHPGLPFWKDYISLAAKAGRTDRMLELVRSVAKRADLSDAQRGGIHQTFYLALLAADQIDEGIAELRKVIAAAGSTRGDSDDTPLAKNVALARLGQLLERPDLLNEGIEGAKKHLMGDPATQLTNTEAVTSLAELLTEVNRGPEAERILAQALNRISTLDEANGSSTAKPECLAALMRVYFKAGRPDDVLAVLDKFPGWGAPDLKDIIEQETDGFSIAEFSTHAAADDYPVGYMAAWALAQKGQKEDALKIDNALLDLEGGFDPGFELLTKISGQDAIPRLDALFARDRFEQRPLIWKAQLQLDAGKLDDAEKTVRAAITIDPSDGEQGPGRRMREYAVLADVLDKKGDKEHADIYRGAVTAIRMSEHADRFYEAGLLTRAVKMYEDALTHFADAYCIQSRLALRLSELGDNAGAEEHYRRAYELMPESFGRVESHCFGCEQAFDGAKPQSIADQVFTQLAAKMPEKPQIHYLLGYLRSEEERYGEALPEFQQAVKLDPDYLNAWKEIGDLGSQMHLPAKLRNEVVLNQVRLDPLQRHGNPEATNVTDLAALWNAVAATKSLQPPPPGPLLPLTASAAEIKNAPSGPNDGASDNESNSRNYRDPAGCILDNRFLAAVSQIFTAINGWESE